MTFRIATIVFLLIAGIITNSAQAPSTSSDWSLSLPQGLMITSAVTVTNKCSSDNRIKLESKGLKFLILPVEPVAVGGDRTISVPVQFNTKNLKPGKHEAVLSIICTSCGNDSGCLVDREDRKVVLTVLPAMGKPQLAKDPVFDPRPVANGEATAPINPTASPTIAALREFLKGPCPERERDCDSLRRKADALQGEVKVLSTKVFELQLTAARARRNADAIEPDDRSQGAVEIRQRAEAADLESTAAVSEAAKATEASEAALSEYKKCLLRVKEECRKKN